MKDMYWSTDETDRIHGRYFRTPKGYWYSEVTDGTHVYWNDACKIHFSGDVAHLSDMVALVKAAVVHGFRIREDDQLLTEFNRGMYGVENHSKRHAHGTE